VIDVSPGGALVETGHPLRPGSDVDVHFECDHRRGRFTAHVVRCDVFSISSSSGTTYRAALAFREVCDWVCEAATRDESNVPTEGGLESAADAGERALNSRGTRTSE
jgi:hypothetical protein